jgi:hypothetical protein
MYCPSFCRNPVDPVAFTDSDPAKSTNDNEEIRTGPSNPAALPTDDDDVIIVDDDVKEAAAAAAAAAQQRLSNTRRNTE